MLQRSSDGRDQILATPPLAYRPEIDGLRAIAVLGVLLFHAGFPAVSGGYAGVDVFFVISGYLITRIILRATDAGEFSFVAFFINRVRRLFPALLTTVAVSLFLGGLLFSPPIMKKLAEAAIVSVLGLSNIYFWSEAGYWDIESAFKPLLHIWSLSLEEQYYVLFPPLLLLAPRGKDKRAGRIALVAMLGLASLLGAAALGLHHPRATFFWMPWRAFEFMIGAAVIWVDPATSRLGRRPFEIMAVSGVMLILVPFVVYGEHTPFPFPGALAPCIGAALLILAGGSCRTAGLWTNPLMLWTGRISYSLYLVHWPLMVYYSYWRFDPLSGSERIGLVIASFALALPLHRFVENRFKRSRAPRSSDLVFLPLSAAAALGIMAIAFSAKLDDGWPWRVPQAQLDPAILAKLTAWCSDDAGICGPPAKVALIGDSHADQYAGAVAESLKQAGVRGALYRTVNACALMSDNYAVGTLDERPVNKCRIGQREWRERIEAENPSLVMLSSFWMYGVSHGYPARFVGDDSIAMPDLAQSRARFERKFTETIGWLTARGSKVVIIGSTVLVDGSPADCYGRPRYISSLDCAKLNVISDPEAQAYLAVFFRKLAASRSDVLYVDVATALCSAAPCPLSENGVSLYLDRHHLTPYGAMWVQRRTFAPLTEFAKRLR
ncbi:MAG TPA: acyltransferase family protein [Bradyrhizobium sp.]|nr:acyltransferase family protein [Bradyrhizobium sp.]